MSKEGASVSESESTRVSEAQSELSLEELRDWRSAWVRGTVPSTVLISDAEDGGRIWCVADLMDVGP